MGILWGNYRDILSKVLLYLRTNICLIPGDVNDTEGVFMGDRMKGESYEELQLRINQRIADV